MRTTAPEKQNNEKEKITNGTFSPMGSLGTKAIEEVRSIVRYSF
jgi:hypothetical protein